MIRTAVAVLLLSPSSLLAGVEPPAPQFGVDITLNALVIRNPADPAPIFTLFPGIEVIGFTDPNHPANLARIESVGGAFFGATGSGSSSVAFPDIAGLRNAIANPAGWRIDIIDGESRQLYQYELTVDPSGLVNDHMRPLSLTSLLPGTHIGLNPTFSWTIAPQENPGNPLTRHDIALATLLGPAAYFNPPLSVTETSWSPAGPILPGTYTLYVQFQGTDLSGQMVVPTVPQPTGNAPPLDAFNFQGFFGSYAAAPGLIANATPPPCPADLNNDAQVNTADLALLLVRFGQNVTPGSTGDINSDGVVNTADLALLLVAFGRPCPIA